MYFLFLWGMICVLRWFYLLKKTFISLSQTHTDREMNWVVCDLIIEGRFLILVMTREMETKEKK